MFPCTNYLNQSCGWTDIYNQLPKSIVWMNWYLYWMDPKLHVIARRVWRYQRGSQSVYWKRIDYSHSCRTIARGCRSRDRMVVGFTLPVQSVATFVWPLKLWVQTLFVARCTWYNVIMWQSLSVTCKRPVVFSVFRFPLLIKLTGTL